MKKTTAHPRPCLVVALVLGAVGIIAAFIALFFVTQNWDLISGWLTERFSQIAFESQSIPTGHADAGAEETQPGSGAVTPTLLRSPEMVSTNTAAATLTPNTPATPTSHPSPTYTLTVTVTATSRATATVTATPTQTRTPPSRGSWEACPGTYLSRLRVNDRAVVSTTPNLPNRVRSAAGTSTTIVGQIKPGEKIRILAGPSCVDNWVWWRIQSEKSGLTGWTAEGDFENYWLVPLQ